MAETFDLSKKVGPLPMGAWIAVVAGGLGIAYFINRNQPPDDTSVELPDSDVGRGGSQLIYDEPERVTPEVEESNASWGREATNWLIAQGHDPTIADSAVRKYLSVLDLNTAESAMITLVLARFGTPPEALPPKEPVEGQPEISTNQPARRLVKRYGWIRVNGKVTLDGQPTGNVETVTIVTYRNSIPLNTRAVTTDTQGNFSLSFGGWGTKVGSTRAYDIKWRGAKVRRYVTLTKR